MNQTAHRFRAHKAKALPQVERDALVLQYFELLEQGLTAHSALDPPQRALKKPGRKKQSASKNLLDVLLSRAEQVLAFLDDLRIPFTKQVGTYYGDLHAQISGSVTSTVNDSSQEPMYTMAITGIFHKNGMTAYTIGFSALADRMYVWSVSALDKQGNEVWVDHVLKLQYELFSIFITDKWLILRSSPLSFRFFLRSRRQPAKGI